MSPGAMGVGRNPYTVSHADRDAFEQLLEDIEIKQPYGGYSQEQDLPRLKPADLAVVMRAKPGLLDDFSIDTLDVADILADKTILGGMTLAEYLHAALMAYASKEAKRALLETLLARQDAEESV